MTNILKINHLQPRRPLTAGGSSIRGKISEILSLPPYLSHLTPHIIAHAHPIQFIDISDSE